MQSLVVLRTRSAATAAAPFFAQPNLPSAPESSPPKAIPAQVTPAPALPYSGAHLDGIPTWNWDSPYGQGTGTWSRSYAENAMQSHLDPNRSHRNWIFGLR